MNMVLIWSNDIIFIPIKSVCTVFKSNAYKLYHTTVFIGQEASKYISEFKYLGFSFSDSKCDNCDMLRQMRSLYAKSNRLIRTFSYCLTDIKITLFQSCCITFFVPSCGPIIENQHLQRFVSDSTRRGVMQVQYMQITISARIVKK